MAHEVHPDLSEYYVRVYNAIREYVFYGGAGDEALQHQGTRRNHKNMVVGLGPSQYELQVATRCSSTTVRKAILELRRRGLVEQKKFSARSLRPTDVSRTISKEPLDPWARCIGAPNER